MASIRSNMILVVKTRLQTMRKATGEKSYSGVAEALRRILVDEGPAALFKGALCRMMVMAPLFAIAQTVYYIGVAEFILRMPKAQH